MLACRFFVVAEQNRRYNKPMTIVLDNLPANVVEVLTMRAKLEGKSLQNVITEILVRWADEEDIAARTLSCQK